MSDPMAQQPLAPRPSEGVAGPASTPVLQRPRKITTACAACKLRKTKCTGGHPCNACSARSSECNYDATADQRRKIANRRNLDELNEANHKLESHRKLLGGIIATIRAGSDEQMSHLIGLIRQRNDLSQLAAHIRNGLNTDRAIYQDYSTIVFEIDGPPELPSPTQLLAHGNAFGRLEPHLRHNSLDSDSYMEE